MKKCYCIHCGYKNSIKNKYCQHCHKKLKEKDHALYHYIFEQSVDDMKDNVISSIVDKIKFFIKKYLYGVIISLTIIASVVTNIVIRNSNDEYITHDKPIFNENVTKYTSSDALLEEFKRAYLQKDLNTLYALMYDTNFIKDAQRLGLNPSKNGLIENIDIFNKSNPKILYSISNLNEVNNIEAYGEVATKLKNNGYDLYLATLTLVYYAKSNNESESLQEITFFDYDLLLVNIEGNYYIAEIVYYNDLERLNQFYDMSGDVSMYDM